MYTRTQINALIHELNEVREQGETDKKIQVFLDVLTNALIHPVDFFQFEIKEASEYVAKHKTISVSG